MTKAVPPRWVVQTMAVNNMAVSNIVVRTMANMQQLQAATTLFALGTTLTLGLPAMAQSRSVGTDSDAYRRCGKDLADAKLEAAVAADACASALRPEELGRCVADLTQNQTVVALSALEACRRVHRPIELQACVQDITRQDAKATVTPVLEACRQSLLPVRYGRCVVGLNQSLNVATTVGLATCLNASDRPQTVESDFIQLERLSRFDNAGPAQLTGAPLGMGTGMGTLETRVSPSPVTPTIDQPAGTALPGDQPQPAVPQLY